MAKRRWIGWSLTLVGLVAGSQALGWLLVGQGPAGLGRAVAGVGAVAALAWVYAGLWAWRSRRWACVAAGLFIASQLVALVMGLLAWRGSGAMVMAVGGVWAMAMAFALGLVLIRLILSPGHPVLGIARTLVDEAVRMRVALVFVVALALMVPVLPALLNPQELLHYRLRLFLNWTISGTALLLSLMTVFLAVATVGNEISRRQIYLTLSKPVSRGQYLLGKWLGIVVLDLWLLAVAGLGIYVFARVLAAQPARDEAPGMTAAQAMAYSVDRRTVQEQVLVARQTAQPQPPEGLRALVAQRLEQLRREDPANYGTPDNPRTLSDAQLQQVANLVRQKWHTVPAGGTATFVFSGLPRLAQDGPPLQLRIKARAERTPPDGRLRLPLWLNGRAWPVMEGEHQAAAPTNGEVMVIDLPAAAVDEQGRLELRIANPLPSDGPEEWVSSVSFTPGEGMEMLYRVASFERNLLCALALVALQLAFLAALGLAAGALLSFPVACLVCLLVLVVGSSTPFLRESLEYYGTTAPRGMGQWESLVWVLRAFFGSLTQADFGQVFKMLVRMVGQATLWSMPALARFSPATLVADGRLVGGPLMVQALLQMGLAWTGTCALAGWFLFRRRELARATA